MSTQQPTYDADAIDELTLECRPPTGKPEQDPAYVAVCHVVWATSHILESISRYQRLGGRLGGAITQEYVDTLAAAFQTGRRVLDHDDHDALQDDLGRADRELLEVLAEDVEPVAGHFDVVLDLPTPDAADRGGESADE